MSIGKIVGGILMASILGGCQMVDWHCTKGGQWSAGYTLEDGRCTYYCADPEEKFCGKTTAEAEAKMANDPSIKKQRQAQADAGLAQDKALCGKLGFKPDTDGMANCLLTQHQNRVGVAAQNKEAQMAGAKAEAQTWANLANRPIVAPQVSQPIQIGPKLNCQTYGNNTTCY